ARDWLAGRDLSLRSVRRQVRTDARPADAAVDRPVQILRPVIDHLRIVRIDLNRRLTHESIVHVLRCLAVPLLPVDPVVLLLPRVDVVPAELTLAVAVHDFAVGRGTNLAALAA